MRTGALTRREVAAFVSFAEAVIAPRDPLPPIAATDAAAFFNDYLARSPRVNRAALRALLAALDLGPLLLGYGHRLRRLPSGRRDAYLRRIRGGRTGLVLEVLESIVKLAYYGDDAVMRHLGYDAQAVVARGRELRSLEGRW